MLRVMFLMLLMGLGATALAQNGRVGVPSNDTACQELADKPVEAGLQPDATRAKASAVRNKYAPVAAMPQGGGARGGGDDDASPLPRPRTPKWHSFLPGMFR